MDYERIHKTQNGILSPSKLRMKLVGSHHLKKKDESNSNSSRHEDSEFVNNSLLETQNGEFGEEASVSKIPPVKSDCSTTEAVQENGNSMQSKELVLRESEDDARFKMQLTAKGEASISSSVHPVRTYEDENLDYDSTSSFEFHKGERPLHHSLSRSFSRPMSSKWNDAEKWIMNRPNMQSKKTNQMNRPSTLNVVKVIPESTNSAENKPSLKRVDFCQPAAPASDQVRGGNGLLDLCPESKDLTEVDDAGLPCSKSVIEAAKGVPAIRSVSMRDMGTEMTPIPSQEPSRSTTPVSSTTPIRSPSSSRPSTPQRGEPAPTPIEHSICNTNPPSAENCKKELSEQELKLKTRREIVELGVQLGKMNIAAWASKDDKDKSTHGNETVDPDEVEQIEYAKRASAWEEAEKSKHVARFKREEIRIQAWESQQKAKLEAEMRKIEAQIEQMKAQAQAKMVKKIAMARQKSEEKRAAAEAKRNRQAEKTAAQAEYIRQTGRIPSSSFICCGWS